MSPVAVPNVSEGRDAATVARLVRVVEGAGARVLDVHSDRIHNRSVLTTYAEHRVLVAAMTALAREAAASLDLTHHEGVHPRLGVLDVCPFVVDDEPVDETAEAARTAGESIWDHAGLPVYLYGYAARRPECERLPDLRRGGLAALLARLAPDFGREVDPRCGVVCVGARGVLVAFNVWLRCDVATARAIAAEVRTLPGVRALGLDLGDGLAQVSTNLVDPALTGVDALYEEVARRSRARGVSVHATEIVGLPPARFLPDPDAEAARLLLEPGRSLELVLAEGTPS